MIVLVLVIFGALYYTAPNARVSGVRWVTGGAVLALVLWLVASVVLAIYVSNFSSYDKTYGTLGGVVVFLLWLWITNMAILLGAEFNAETERAKQIHTGVPGARRRLRLEEREPATNGGPMRSARQDRAAGRTDTIAGRILEAFAKLTGNRSAGAKGKAARARGAGRSAKGRGEGWSFNRK
jgi:uncharacterized protein YjbJ (UPF0337 family)